MGIAILSSPSGGGGALLIFMRGEICFLSQPKIGPIYQTLQKRGEYTYMKMKEQDGGEGGGREGRGGFMHNKKV